MSLSKKLILVIPLLLSLGLVSCNKVFYKDQFVSVLPDVSYLQDCPLGNLAGNTVEDALQLTRDRLLSLQNCNVDKQALRTWLETNKETHRNEPK